MSKCRHQDVYSTYDSHEVLDIHLPATLKRLSHTQRLAVADELCCELDEIDRSLATCAQGAEPGHESRGWQFGEVTRALSYGQDAYLPDAAALWAHVHLGARTPAELWAARSHLLRVEQLTAACQATGGRAAALADVSSIEAHCVWGDGGKDDRIVSAYPARADRSLLRYAAIRPMTLSVTGGTESRRQTGPADPYDTEAFIQLLGEWVLAVRFRG